MSVFFILHNNKRSALQYLLYIFYQQILQAPHLVPLQMFILSCHAETKMNNLHFIVNFIHSWFFIYFK